MPSSSRLPSCTIILSILQSTFAFIGLLFGLEIHQTSKVFPTFEDVRDGIICPAAFMAGRITPCAAGSAKFKRSGRWNFLLGQYLGNSGRAIACQTQTVYLLDNRGGFLIYNKIAVLVHEIAVYRLTGGGLSAHPLGSLRCPDFLAGVPNEPLIEHTSFGKVKRKQQKSSIHAGLRRDGSRSDSSLSDGQGAEITIA